MFSHILLNDVVNTCCFLSNYINRLISLLNNKQVLTTSLITIWENTDVCAEQYRCASALYLMSVMSKTYSIIIDLGISVPGHGK